MDQFIIILLAAFAGGFGVWFYSNTLGKGNRRASTEETLKDLGIDPQSHVPLRQQLELWRKSTPDLYIPPIPHKDEDHEKKALLVRIHELEKQKGLPGWMGDLGKKITGSIDREAIFKNVSQTLQSMMDARFVILGSKNTRNDGFIWLLSEGEINESLKEVAMRSFQGKELIHIRDGAIEYTRYIYDHLILPDGNPVGSMLICALEVEDRPAGVLLVGSPRKNAYQDGQEGALELLAGFVAVAIDNANVYMQLKETQDQLIRQEKLASLGMLTAGIAHELQNPLNFVNNLSKTGLALATELKESIESQDRQLSEEISDDLRLSLDKIHHHGERASRIIRNMLDQSRQSEGEKSPADINHMMQEFAELAIQSLRGQQSGFHCELITHFDEQVGRPKVYPQELGRVLINLFNNALYAMADRAKREKGSFVPTLQISSKMEKGMLVLTVQDNGGGIPKEIQEKIFLPFFTTKPTGEGTGLGLSLCFDIVRMHGGEMTLQTEQGDYSRFVISLPV